METDRFEHIREVFCQVREAERDERSAVIDELCSGDVELKSMVLKLLAQDVEAEREGFLELPALGKGFHIPVRGDAADVQLPDAVGKYRVDGVLGAGSAATVYRAVSPPPLERAVAVKVLQARSVGRVAERFVAEQRILGLLDHPGIAKVFDAGVAESGELFTVIELIEGGHITTFGREHGLSWRSMVELVQQVADAVAHAHANGVIHRDLKPANILVEDRDDGPHAKVIDFGIARDSVNTSASLSLQGQVVGTLRYMSPEQLDGGRADARSDVYALGIVLFELLEGRHPFGGPETPLSDLVASVSASVIPRMERLPKSVRGDLHAVVCKACRRYPDGRYPTMEAFSTDLARVLAGKPVQARSGSTVYTGLRFIRSHWVSVLGVVAVLSLVAGLGVRSVLSGMEAVEQRGRLEGVLLGLSSDVLEKADHLRGTHEVRRELHAVLVDAFEDARQAGGDSPMLRSSHASVLLSSASAKQQAGEIPSGLEDAQTAFELLERLADEQSDDLPLRRRMIEARIRMGDLLVASGDLESGHKFYMTSHKDLTELAESWTEAIGVLDDLSWSYYRLIDNRLTDNTLAMHHERLELAQRLLELDPDRTQSRFNLAHTHLGLAAVHDQWKDKGSNAELARPHALEAYRLAGELTEIAPQRVEYERLRINAGWRVARTAAFLGLEEAFEVIDECLRVSQSLLAEDPSRQDIQSLVRTTLVVGIECGEVMSRPDRVERYTTLLDALD